MAVYAEVVVNRPVQRRPPAGSDPLRSDAPRMQTFTYRLPPRLHDLAAPGHLVQVPLGAGRAVGVVIGLADAAPAALPAESIREVDEILDPLPVVTLAQIELARWIAEHYIESLSAAMRLMLPPGIAEHNWILVARTEAAARADTPADQAAVLRLLERHGEPMRLASLARRLRLDDADRLVDALTEQGLVVTRHAFLPPRPAPPRVQYVSLLADGEAVRRALPYLGRPSQQADALLVLARRSDAPLALDDLCRQANCTPAVVRQLAERGWVAMTEARTLVVALPGAAAGAAPDPVRAPKQAAALAALQRQSGPLELAEFLRRTGVSSSVIVELERKGLVRRIAEPEMVLLTLPPEQVLDAVVELRRGGVERAVLTALQGTVGRTWVGGLYAQTGATLSTLQRLAARGLIGLHATATDVPAPLAAERPPELTPDQAAVWEQLAPALAGSSATGATERIGERPSPAGPGVGLPPAQEAGQKAEGQPLVALLHGVTGAGKTELYLRAIEATLARNRRSVVLVPEISLTAQTVRRFEARFPGRVAVLHSQLTLGQRYQVWDRVRRGEVPVLIGPRSALLAPMPQLGLIVIDEAHDASYKQEEPIPLPAYHACDVAEALGRLTGATVLLGTATPDVVMYHRAQMGQLRLFDLPQRVARPVARPAVAPPVVGRGTSATDGGLPPAHIVDLRQELQAGNRRILSRLLQELLARTLHAGEQAILFLNRRGAATFVLCRDCGYVARCPRCDVPLALHRAGVGGLVCHRCNHRQPSPQRCPACGSRRIRYFGLGTERVEEELHALFPGVRLLRWDRDTAAGPDHERYLSAFVEHQADVLVGTQMIAKGLDLPLVTLVGVVSADTALNLPDYRAAERTFQLLTQVAGRAGRSRRGGRVVIQTYHPDHYAIRAAAGHDFISFYRQELAHRRKLGLPPFSRLVVLRLSDPDPRRCQTEAERLGRWLTAEIRRLGLPDRLIGPAPCFFSRLQDRFRWQIVLRTPDPAHLLRNLALPWGWRVDVDPVSLL